MNGSAAKARTMKIKPDIPGVVEKKGRNSWTERERAIVLAEHAQRRMSIPKLRGVLREKHSLDVPLPTLYKWIKGRRAKLKSLSIPSNYADLPEFWYLVGVIQGDGYVSKIGGQTYTVSIAVKDTGHAKILMDIIRRLFDYSPGFQGRPDCSYVRMTAKGLRDLFSNFKTPRRWNVPEEVFGKDVVTKGAYLRGLFDTDGHVAFYPRNDEYDRIDSGITLNIDNTEAAKGVQRLLGSIGIMSRYYLINYKKNGKDYKIDRIVIKNQTHIIQFASLVGFLHPRKTETLQKLIGSYKGKQIKYYNTRGMILDLLKGGESSTPRISESLERSHSTINEHLKKLEKDGLVGKRTEHFNRWGVCNKSLYKRNMWRLA